MDRVHEVAHELFRPLRLRDLDQPFAAWRLAIRTRSRVPLPGVDDQHWSDRQASGESALFEFEQTLTVGGLTLGEDEERAAPWLPRLAVANDRVHRRLPRAGAP